MTTKRLGRAIAAAIIGAGVVGGGATSAWATGPDAVWAGGTAKPGLSPAPALVVAVAGQGEVTSPTVEHVVFECESTAIGIYFTYHGLSCYLLGANGVKYSAPDVDTGMLAVATTGATLDVPVQTYKLCFGTSAGAPTQGINLTGASGCFAEL